MNAKRRKQIDKAANLLRDCVENLVEAKNILGEVAGEERDYYDNMSDNLRCGERGEQAERAAEALEEVYTALEEFDADDLVGKLEEAKE
jgi:flagellar biosynthesis chaperone FliJ